MKSIFFPDFNEVGRWDSTRKNLFDPFEKSMTGKSHFLLYRLMLHLCKLISAKERTFMRILIVDDSPAIRDRLVKMVFHIQNAMVVGLASKGEETVASI
jgi:hypothetical protein